MPTVLIVKGYRFFFFASERNEPVHIHVEKAEGYAKYWLNPVALARSRGCRSHQLREVRELVVQHRELFEEKWNEFFTSSG